MNKPKMIIFDYGHTLLWERDFDFGRGYRAIFEHVSANPNGVTSDEMQELSEGIFNDVQVCRTNGFEIHEFPLLRCASEALGVEFSLPLEDIETILWTNASNGGKMPHISELLAYLKSEGIRTGVISNIGWSGGALKRRIERLLPEGDFEFIITSSEYAVRKPNPLIFKVALQKSGLKPDEVWFCGDNIKADVNGAHGAGIFPVYYDCIDGEIDSLAKSGTLPDFDYLHIHDWRELIDILKDL